MVGDPPPYTDAPVYSVDQKLLFILPLFGLIVLATSSLVLYTMAHQWRTQGVKAPIPMLKTLVSTA